MAGKYLKKRKKGSGMLLVLLSVVFAGVGLWVTMLVVSALGFAVTVLVMCKRRRA